MAMLVGSGEAPAGSAAVLSAPVALTRTAPSTAVRLLTAKGATVAGVRRDVVMAISLRERR